MYVLENEVDKECAEVVGDIEWLEEVGYAYAQEWVNNNRDTRRARHVIGYYMKDGSGKHSPILIDIRN